MTNTTQHGRGPAKRTRLFVGIATSIVLALPVLAVIVTQSDDSKPGITTTTSSTATTLVTDDTKIIADYRAFWDAFLIAANPMRPDHPAIQQHATGEELRLVVENFTGAKIDNLIFKGTIDTNARVVEKTATTATVSDCMFDRTGAYDATTGERKDEEDTERKLNTARLELVGDTWKVASVTKERVGCEAP